MNVVVQERKFSLRTEYDISGGGMTLFAQKSFFPFASKIQLQSADGQVLANLRSHFSLLRDNFDFNLTQEGLYKFWLDKMWKGVYVCQGNGEQYRMYQHKGLQYSVFKGEQQIAAITKNQVTIGNGHKYDIAMNSDANLTVIVCMVLAMNTPDDSNGSTITYDFGSLGPQDRNFDESWTPT